MIDLSGLLDGKRVLGSHRDLVRRERQHPPGSHVRAFVALSFAKSIYRRSDGRGLMRSVED